MRATVSGTSDTRRAMAYSSGYAYRKGAHSYVTTSRYSMLRSILLDICNRDRSDTNDGCDGCERSDKDDRGNRGDNAKKSELLQEPVKEKPNLRNFHNSDCLHW